MKKLVALLVSASILVLSSVPAQAQNTPKKIVRGIKAITAKTPNIKPSLAYPGLSVPSAAAAAGRVSQASIAVNVPPASAAPVAATPLGQAPAPQAPKLLSQEDLQNLHRGVEKAAAKAAMGENLNYAQIRSRIAAGKTARLAERILTYPNENVRQGMLRNEFVQVAVAGNATASQIQRAADFWRSDLKAALSSFSSLPQGDLKALAQAFKQKNANVQAVNQALADAAALGIYGSEEDASLIWELYQKAAGTPAEPLVSATAARALLRLGAQKELSQLAQSAGGNSPLWNSISQAAQKKGLTVTVPSKEIAAAQTKAFVPVLNKLGKVNAMAADPSAEATALYLNLGSNQAETVAPVQSQLQPIAAAPEIELPPLGELASADALQIGSLSVAGGENVAPAAAGRTAPLTVFQQAARAIGLQKLAQNRAEALAIPQAGQKMAQTRAEALVANQSAKTAASSRSGALYGGLPIPEMWKSAQKAAASIKNFFKAQKANPAALPQENSIGAMQRASLYLASFMMGLEVATPVIANIGTSFGLSLSDNILVSVATYLPYSLGAFLSNWIKEKIGRKASMNLGLALMGAGFTAGVALFGLNGSFVPYADMWNHFLGILGCITVASTGGVFVHNAVGPIMTDLSAGASELVRQERIAMTELSRAAGMSASFAFPFLATNVLGQDWSFTFAMPIPLVAAAALGVNLSKIPNTKPAVAPKLEPVPVPVGSKRNRRAYQITSSILNNSYIRLFKEEKGVLPLLTGLLTMNAVEMSYSNGFLFLAQKLTGDSPYQYLFGLAQFALPFLMGRYLAKGFLKWFPKNNMTIATLISAIGGLAAVPLSHDIYALTAALFVAEVGISTAFTLSFAQTAKNPKTQDRIVSLIVASAISCAFGPMLLTGLAEKLMNTGILSSADATTAALIAVPSVLAFLSAVLFRKLEKSQAAEQAADQAAEEGAEKIQKTNWFKKLWNRLFGKNK